MLSVNDYLSLCCSIIYQHSIMLTVEIVSIDRHVFNPMADNTWKIMYLSFVPKHTLNVCKDEYCIGAVFMHGK